MLTNLRDNRLSISIHSTSSRSNVWIALGSNQRGPWGSPTETLTAALRNIRSHGVAVKIASDIYLTRAIGGGRQPHFFNAIACINSNLPPATLLRLLKSMERAAGRRLGRHWGPRTLDLDIIATGTVVGRRGASRRIPGQIILPHPEMHKRAFVAAPLAQIAPHWWHPIEQRSIRQILQSPVIRRQLTDIRRLEGTAIDLLRT